EKKRMPFAIVSRRSRKSALRVLGSANDSASSIAFDECDKERLRELLNDAPPLTRVQLQTTQEKSGTLCDISIECKGNKTWTVSTAQKAHQTFSDVEHVLNTLSGRIKIRSVR